MRKTALFTLMLTLAFGAKAQFGDYGMHSSIGAATITDDLSTSSAIFGFSKGGYINYTFKNTETAFGEIFYLQSGLNFIRRGSNFKSVFEHGTTMSIREGYYHAYYVQLPILACLEVELPIREPGHYLTAFLGPAVNFGIAGRFTDRMVTPGIASTNYNYDIAVTGTSKDKNVFNHIGRIDVDVIFGVSYTRDEWTISAFIDHGFIPTSTKDDAIRLIENNNGNINNTNNEGISIKIPNGNNTAYMIGISYKLGSFYVQ